MKNYFYGLLILLTSLCCSGIPQTNDVNEIDNYQSFLLSYSSKIFAKDFNSNQIEQKEIKYIKRTIEKYMLKIPLKFWNCN